MRARIGGVAALVAVAWGCRIAGGPPAIDPDLAACLTRATVLIGGAKLERLRASPLYARLAALDPVPEASELLAASDGKSLVWMARGSFPKAPPGAILLNPKLAVSGPEEAVRGAAAQHATHATGVPDLVQHGASLAKGRDIWAVVRGGIALPLTGNLENVNHMLRLVDYATIGIRLGDRIDVDIGAVCRGDQAGQRLEETWRAMVSLAQAANPHLDAMLRSAQIRREGAVVHATLTTETQTVAKLIDALTR